MQLRKFLVMINSFVLILAFCLTGSVAHATSVNGATTVEQAPPTVSPAVAVDNVNELLVYDLNRVVTINDKGFPHDQPPRSAANGNWQTPINFAQGTMHFRAEIRSQSTPQSMKLQFCIWQDQFVLESCGPLRSLTGTAGTVVTWNQPVAKLWKKDGRTIDWSRARMRYGIAIKNRRGLPVSSFQGWNWNGENPALWYPMNMRFTVVVVAKGKTFSGWANYLGAGAATAATAEIELTEEAWAALLSDASYGSSLTLESVTTPDNDTQTLANQLYLPLVSMQ